MYWISAVFFGSCLKMFVANEDLGSYLRH